LRFDEIEIPDDIILIDLGRIFLVIIRENITHFAGVVTHRPWGVILGDTPRPSTIALRPWGLTELFLALYFFKTFHGKKFIM